MSSSPLSVRLLTKPIGTLYQNEQGQLCFQYTSSSLLSLSMPIRQEPYVNCPAFFEGLLPEAEETRRVIAKRYGISPRNIFSLLEAIGKDCAGAVSFHQIDEPIPESNEHEIKGHPLTQQQLSVLIDELNIRPLFTDAYGLRLSLAGVQSKAAVCIVEREIFIPSSPCPTTHIMKPEIKGLSNTIFNEHLCLQLAHKIGLPACKTSILNIHGKDILLIKRYDREIRDKRIKRVHQEDFCQAMGISSSQKYENEGGPSLKSCRTLLKVVEPHDQLLFLKYVIFNVLIGNKDAHGKNYSLLHTKPFHIAPLYDVLCTSIYPNLSSKMAMKIGGKYKTEDVFQRHWRLLCQDLDVSFTRLNRQIVEIWEAMKKALESHNFEVRPQDESMFQKIKNHVIQESEKTVERLQMGS